MADFYGSCFFKICLQTTPKFQKEIGCRHRHYWKTITVNILIKKSMYMKKTRRKQNYDL